VVSADERVRTFSDSSHSWFSVRASKFPKAAKISSLRVNE